MPNRRDIKKDINSVLADVLEECYSEMLHHPEKNDDKINAIIDEAVDLADDLIARVNSAKKLKSGKEVKANFQKIMDELQDKAIAFVEKLNALS
jgi:PDZ domain-containing secreted protein